MGNKKKDKPKKAKKPNKKQLLIENAALKQQLVERDVTISEYAADLLPIAERGVAGIADCSPTNVVHLMTLKGCDEPGLKQWVEHEPLPVPYFTSVGEKLLELQAVIVAVDDKEETQDD
ncbi:MAG: hypothetical protein HQ559_01730 [Lentisphaerae bacterium]|nr:hypothetical protein [Lentisphaerota bacterium]